MNEAARNSGQTRFTALLHHVDVAALERAFRRQRRAASPGVDRVTVDDYERELEANLRRLHNRIHSGQYWPKPVRRTYIPKADGGRRLLGIPALEDKIVQGAVAEVLNAVYEADFMGFSYGFRPERSPHAALAALDKALMTQRVNWVLDVDIRTFFDSVDHGWLLRMLAHRIADRRVLRLIERWLKAGILESGRWEPVEVGTPQGSGISPILANVFLHYAVDLWVHRWRRRMAVGQVIICRYADDRAPRRREEVRDVTSNSWQPCCTRDEGRPLGLGLQDQGPNHRKLRRSNGRGGERCGKRRDQSRQVCAGQTNASEPLLTCRKRRDVAKTRLQLLACDEARRKPADWPSGDRHEDGVRPARGSCAERGNLSPRCEGRPPSGRPTRSRVPMRGEGTDGFVVPSRPGNAGGGKGPDTPAEEAGQPAMGGAGV